MCVFKKYECIKMVNKLLKIIYLYNIFNFRSVIRYSEIIKIDQIKADYIIIVLIINQKQNQSPFITFCNDNNNNTCQH